MTAKKPTKDEREEAVLRALSAARGGYSIYSNPYDEQRQPYLWNVWRFVFADAAPEPGVELPTFVTPEKIQRSFRDAKDALAAAFGVTATGKPAK